jgi:hypothetical protein
MLLKCGHQCPSLCGEVCPSNYCQVCSGRGDEQVDLLLFEKYANIDLESSPIVVLACGHFFTADSLDGVVGMDEVYETDSSGNYIGLRDISSIQCQAVHRCPNCKRTIPQFSTQRYNRAINRATMDETAKLFLTDGNAKLQVLGEKVSELENALTKPREEIIGLANAYRKDLRTCTFIQRNVNVAEAINHQRHGLRTLVAEIEAFQGCVSHKNQPTRKLHDATVKAIQSTQSLETHMRQLAISCTSSAPIYNQVVFGARAMHLLINSVILVDMFETAEGLRKILGEDLNVVIPGADLINATNDFFELCNAFIINCEEENFSKFGVEARLHYARAARFYYSYVMPNGTLAAVWESQKRIRSALSLLNRAKELCHTGFRSADDLWKAVDDMQKLLDKKWYEPASVGELTSIQNAMVNGREGFAIRAGHWYNCQNGHPVTSHLMNFLLTV